MNKTLLTLFVLICSVSVINAEGISVSQSLDKQSIPYEDSVTFVVTLKWDGPQLAYFFDRPLNPAIDRLKVRGFSSEVSAADEAGREVTTKIFRFVLVPTAPGLGTIDPVTISYLTWPDSLPGQLVTEAMTINIDDPKPVVKETKRSFWPWLAGAAFLLVAAGLAIFFRRRRARPATEPVKTPRDKFLDDLTAIKQDAGTDIKKFQTGLHRALTAYIKAKYDFDPVDNMPDDDLRQKLESSGLTPEQASRLTAWTKQAFKDKYSPVAAGPGETIRLESEIRQFFGNL